MSESVLYLLDIGIYYNNPMRFGGAFLNVMEKDPYTGIRFRPLYEDPFESDKNLNSLGLRDDELNLNATEKILCLGDSTTFGYRVKRDSAYPNRLEEKLNGDSDQVFEVLNAGVPSYTLYQGYQLYTHYLINLTEWDYLVITFGWNDIAYGKGGEIDTEYAIKLPPKRNILIYRLLSLSRHFRTYNFLESKFSRMVYKHTDKDKLINLHYQLYYEELVKTAKSQGIKVIILPVVSSHLDGEDNVEAKMAFYNEITKKIADEEDIVYLDIVSSFKEYRERIGWFETIHYDEGGHEVIANELFNYIVNDK